jgi:hypothetical protein
MQAMADISKQLGTFVNTVDESDSESSEETNENSSADPADDESPSYEIVEEEPQD